MALVILVSLLTCVYCYIEAIKWAMNAKRWALAGLILGPFLLPMFGIAKHVHWRRAVGFNNLFIIV